MREIADIFGYLPRAKKVRAMLLLLAMIFAALLEIAGVASVMPFLAILGSPELVQKYSGLSAFYRHTGASSFQEFLIYLAAASFFAIAAAAAFKIFIQFAAQRFAQDVSGWVSLTLFDTYLHQPYAFFLGRNSAQMAQNILSETANAVAHVIHPASMICAYSLVVVFIVSALMVIDPKVSILVLAFFAALYSVILFFVMPGLKTFGLKSVHYNEQRYRLCGEAFGGIKSVKARGLESSYIERFKEPSALYTRYQAYSQVIGHTPRHVIEAMAIGAVMLMALYFMTSRESLGETLSLLGLYALAGNRLLPAAQQLYQGFAQMRYGLPSLRAVLRDMELRKTMEPAAAAVPVKRERPAVIELQDVSYRYPGAEHDTLKCISLSIPANSTVGIVGTSGSGKTTLGDILLGLLRPSGGRILVDGIEQDLVRSRSWKNAVGYVPQEVHMIDATVAENIAFGVPRAKIERAAVEQAARLANIHDFIVKECPGGYDTPTGERGVRISGGERQRLGIARALYYDPPILMLDEATSALDLATERTVMEAIDALSHKKTVIMIAHRVQTLRRADKIVMLDKGRIAAIGSFDELTERWPPFVEITAHGVNRSSAAR